MGNLNLTSSTGDIQVPVTGMDIDRNSGDANYSVKIRDTQGVWEFKDTQLRLAVYVRIRLKNANKNTTRK